MSCTETSTYAEALDAARVALDNQEFAEFFSCMYSGGTGSLIVVGTMFWFVIVAMSYVRSGGKLGMPVVFTLLFGGAALSQVANPVLGMVSVLVLGSFALAVVLFARKAETP